MSDDAVPVRRGRVREVFWIFLRLGLTSFGGPIAHLGYFRDELVTRRRWVDDRGYADLVALAQFLPGPASSQVGFALGLLRAGGWGAIAAFVGFTLPSAVLMVAFAYGATVMAGPFGVGVITGLKIVAVAIVAQAVWGMARSLTPDPRRASIAVVAALVVLLVAGVMTQVVAIALGALAGLALCRSMADADGVELPRMPVRRTVGVMCLTLFAALLVGLPVLATINAWPVALFDAFYRAGALVFGGGHVVLPLLEAELVPGGWVSADQFLAGYGAAQAMPGPLFTFAGYLGALAQPGGPGILGALIALVAVFLPGFLLLVGVLPFWSAVRTRRGVRAAMHGANAAVVGILAAALYDPIFVSAVVGPASFGLALVCFVLLAAWRTPAWAVVLAGAAGGVVLTLTGAG